MTGTTLTPRRRIRITEVIYCLAVWLQRTDWGTALFWCRYHGSSRLLVSIRYKRQVRRLRWVSHAPGAQQPFLSFTDQTHTMRESNVFTGVYLPTGEGLEYILSRSCLGRSEGGVGYLSQVTLLLPQLGLVWGGREREEKVGTITKWPYPYPPHPCSWDKDGSHGLYCLVMFIGGYGICVGIKRVRD